MPEPKVSDEDIAMLNYFWREKEDLKRWSSWPDFKSRHPDTAAMLEAKVKAVEKANLEVTRAILALSRQPDEDEG